MLDENAVVDAVCRHLEDEGYKILQKCLTTAQGIDIIARYPNSEGRLLIEAKGATSSRTGSARSEVGFSGNQVFDRVAKGFHTTACMYTVDRREGDAVGWPSPIVPTSGSTLGELSR